MASIDVNEIVKTINVDVTFDDFVETFEFSVDDYLTAGAIAISIRTACGLSHGSVRRGRGAFGVDKVLEPGDYTFTGFSREGEYSHVSFIPSL